MAASGAEPVEPACKTTVKLLESPNVRPIALPPAVGVRPKRGLWRPLGGTTTSSPPGCAPSSHCPFSVWPLGKSPLLGARPERLRPASKLVKDRPPEPGMRKTSGGLRGLKKRWARVSPVCAIKSSLPESFSSVYTEQRNRVLAVPALSSVPMSATESKDSSETRFGLHFPLLSSLHASRTSSDCLGAMTVASVSGRGSGRSAWGCVVGCENASHTTWTCLFQTISAA